MISAMKFILKKEDVLILTFDQEDSLPDKSNRPNTLSRIN